MYHNLTLKEWESNFFNQTIFDFDFEENQNIIHSWPEKSLITAKVNASDYLNLNTVNRHGFNFCEGELFFQKIITPLEYSNDNIDFSNCLANESSIDELKLIVIDLYTNSRFREPWFSDIDKDRFYQEWVENAVLSKFDDCCLVIKNNNLISGFITIRIRDNQASIGLIGVSKGFQKKGLGKKLLHLAEQYCAINGAENISVATQTSNFLAANLYSKSGFNISNIAYWFYKKV